MAPWVGNDRSAIADVLDDHGTSKWHTRTDNSYRSSILGYAENKRRGVYDPLPYWVLREVAVEDGLLTRGDLVQRDGDTGEVVTDTGAASDTYTALPSGTYNDVLEHIENEYRVDHGRTRIDKSSSQPTADELGLGGVEEDPEQAAQNVLALLELTGD